MRRWFALLLIVFLPLQLSWAAASVYCQHESGTQSSHFGHHEHQHHAQDDAGDAKSKGGTHHDCGPCHAGCSVGLCGGIAQPGGVHARIDAPGVAEKYPAGFPSQPERPKWAALA